MSEIKPKISIITVCYNSESIIDNTFKSVLKQDYSAIEYLVIDGNSNDNTLSIIENYTNQFGQNLIDFKYISEQDKGIYDAMNKGILMASGDYVIFMNAGDVFYENNTISKVYEKSDFKDVVIYGLTSAIHFDRVVVQDTLPLDTLWKGMRFCHQSVFIKTDVAKKFLYDTNLKIVADMKQFLEIYHSNYSFRKVDVIVSSFMKDGISSTAWKTVLNEKVQVLKESNKLTFKRSLYYKLVYLLYSLVAILPQKFVPSKWRF